MGKKFIKTVPLAELSEGEITAVKVGGENVALVNLAGTVHAVNDICPHVGAPLSQGWVEVADKQIVCPMHSWEFNLCDGRGTTVEGSSVECYRVKVENGDVYVEVFVAADQDEE